MSLSGLLRVWWVGAKSASDALVRRLDAQGHDVRSLSEQQLLESLAEQAPPDVVLRTDGGALPALPTGVLGVAGRFTDQEVAERLDGLAKVVLGRDLLRVRAGFVDRRRGVVYRRDGVERLTELELRLLSYLAERPGEVVGREALLVEVWDLPATSRTRSVSVIVSRLRAKIERDPRAPEHLVSVYGEGYRFEPLEAPRERERATNVVAPDAPLVARELERAQLEARLERGPALLTLQGLGGVGKTRLAREVAWRWACVGRPTWWVELEEARSAGDVVRAIAAVSGVAISEVGTALAAAQRLGAELSRTPEALIVLDGVEHLLAPLVEVLGAPGFDQVRVVLTSRRALQAMNEHLVRVAPLGPAEGRALLGACVERGRRQPLRDDEARVAEALVAQVDGLPLALELVGAQAAVRSLGEILAGIRADPGALRHPGREGDRHGDLQACIAWSWEVLGALERRVLEAAVTFRGSFTLSALAALLDEPLDRWIGAVHELIEQELVLSVVGSEGTIRLGLRQPVRHFVLARARPDAHLFAERHARWFAEHGERWIQQAVGLRARPEASWLDAESTEVAQAFAHALDHLPEVAGRLGAALGTSLSLSGPAHDALDVLDRAEHAMSPGKPEVRLQMLRARARASFLAGRHQQADTAAERSVGVARHLGDAGALATALVNLGGLHTDLARRRVALEEARTLLREVHEPALEGVALHHLALLATHDGDRPGAVALVEEALRRAAVAGRPTWLHAMRVNHALLLINAGRDDEAIAVLGALAGDDADRLSGAADVRVQGYLALAHHAAGHLEEAGRAYASAVSCAEQVGDAASRAMYEANLGLLQVEVGARAAGVVRVEEAAARVVPEVHPAAAASVFLVGSATFLAAGRRDEAERLRTRARPLLSHLGQVGPALDATLVARGQAPATTDGLVRVVWRALAPAA